MTIYRENRLWQSKRCIWSWTVVIIKATKIVQRHSVFRCLNSSYIWFLIVVLLSCSFFFKVNMFNLQSEVNEQVCAKADALWQHCTQASKHRQSSTTQQILLLPSLVDNTQSQKAEELQKMRWTLQGSWMLSNVTLFCWVTIIAWVVSLNFQKWQNIYKGSQVSCVAFEGCLLNAFFHCICLWLVVGQVWA